MNCSLTDCEYCPYYDSQYDRCGFEGDVFDSVEEGDEPKPLDEIIK